MSEGVCGMADMLNLALDMPIVLDGDGHLMILTLLTWSIYTNTIEI